MTWATENPKAKDVLKALISLPEFFEVKQLYRHDVHCNQKYVLRGMICFSNGHYFSFSRRMAIKTDLIDGLDERQKRMLKDNEVKNDTEWILFNDEKLSFVKDNWTGVLNDCIEKGAYPTVLFYEKLADDKGNEIDFKRSRGFSDISVELSTLQRAANEQDWTMGDIYETSAQEIET